MVLSIIKDEENDPLNHSNWRWSEKTSEDVSRLSRLFTLIMKKYCDINMKPPNEKINDVHQISLKKLLEKDQMKAALEYMDFNLQSGYVLPGDIFEEFVFHSYGKRNRKKMNKILVSFIEKFMKNDQAFIPSWNSCFYMLHMSLQAQNSELAYYAFVFIRKFIAAAEISRPSMHYFVKEELIILVLQLAGETRNIKLFDVACILLDLSLGQNVAEADTFVAKICAYASLGNLKLAHNSLFELESLYRDTTQEATDLFCPFSVLNPLAMAYSKDGYASIDSIYYQLEDSNKENPRYKSVAALNCLILGCANIGDTVRAWQTFESIGSTFGLTPDVDSYNCLICACLKGDEREEALQLFEDLVYWGLKPDATTYALLLHAHVTARDSKSALSVIEEMVISGFEPTKKVLKKIYTCAIMEDNDVSKDHVRALAIKFDIPMSSKVFREREEDAHLAPPKSYEKLPTSSWEDKFKYRVKKVSLESTRKVESRRKREENEGSLSSYTSLDTYTLFSD
ncbi:Pentatricopeptide repeat-containing protein, mitochondrial [Heracleum sosnowskyi]|uniref:Pentatricopeptide repeat-containing protein, mitochondrial n=1 Tax=Heracleum sosnowskyi TaxID=360622 RepID=A0AAD8MC01_9APIA|nr:Pentatricopeptide repeat-containing protein, mitochondrial [Heracleum sosnowskyi]